MEWPLGIGNEREKAWAYLKPPASVLLLAS